MEHTRPAGESCMITFLIPDETGHGVVELDPAAAAERFAELRGLGRSVFDVTSPDPEKHVLVVDPGVGGSSLPERLLVMDPYVGG